MDKAREITSKMDSLSINSNCEMHKSQPPISSSSSDISETSIDYVNGGCIIRKKLREFQIPPDICPHCFYIYYKYNYESMYYNSCVLTISFFLDSIPVYRVILQKYRDVWKRDRRTPRFSDKVYFFMFEECQKLVKKYNDRLDWSFATSIGNMYNDLSLTWIICSGVHPITNKLHRKPL